jgi:prepilin-type processing-associated H-X9-DG protein
MLFCPGDDTNDPTEELDKIVKEKVAPGFCSYLYRQLHETNLTGKLESLGRNTVDDFAEALALDLNSMLTFDPTAARSNHEAKRVNILYADGSVLRFDNRKDLFSLRDQDMAVDPTLATRRAEILQEADRGR